MNIRAAVLLAALGVVGSVPTQAATTMYCCNDANGRKACGDTLPEVCYGRAYRITDERGTHQVEAPLTADQKAQRAADTKRKQEEERLALDERRRNAALLSSYSTVDDIDYMRDRALKGIEKELAGAQAKYDAIVARKRQLAAQVATVKPGTGDDLLADLRAADSELKGQQRVIETKRQEMTDVRVKFENEKKRYLELSQGSKGTSPTATTPPAAGTSAAKPR